MLKPIYIKQIWKGTFTYLAGYTIKEQYITVDFQLELEVIENNFEGISVDSESKHIFFEPVLVKGFFDNEKISFIIKYPYNYYRNDHGKLIGDKSKEHPDIHYLGFFNEDKTEVNGNWEMTMYEEKYLDDYIVEIANGSFEMRKV